MKPKINRIWGYVTLALLLLTLILCAVGANRGVLLVRSSAKPEETAKTFFDSIVAGRYPEADACLANYKSLGLEKLAQSREGAALLASYAYTMEEKPVRHGGTAVQTVQLRYLDMKALEKALATPMTTIPLADGGSRPVYYELRELLEKPEKYYTTAELQVTLRYSEGQWRVVADESLLSALAGGK